jgi:acetyl-CoA synthetase
LKRFEFEGDIVWRPTAELIAHSNLQHFMDRHGIATLEELQRRSTTDLEWFWKAVIETLDIRFDKPYSRLLDLSRGIQWPVWCAGGEMNIIHNCLDKYSGTATDQKIALRWEGESDATMRTLTYAELRSDVNRAATYFRSLGFGKGDVIGVYMPMISECVIAMLAIIKIGAVFLPLFSGFGAKAVAARLLNAGARGLITAERFQRRGQVVAMKVIADEAASMYPNVKVILPEWQRFHNASETEPTSAEDVMMLIYTSGTSGPPKGAVHTHCGFPIKAAQDIWMGLDLHADETMFWITDMGWMMGPWLVFGTLLLGTTMLIYDGSLDYPRPDRLWSIIENHRVTTLGISPTLTRAMMRHNETAPPAHDLSSLRKFGSTGEPWNPELWLWLFNVIGRGKLPIINYSGGTEISGGILMGNVLTPLKPCAFSGPVPGMDADVVDEQGRSIQGEVGELVVRQPWIGMTRGFWNDPNRYIESYWSRFPNIWDHGDWAARDKTGLWYILGRSDDTIKIAGKRLGPAEVEAVLVEHPSVSEAAAIGVPDPAKGEALVCFCVLKDHQKSHETLRAELKDRVTRALGKPFAPHDIRFVRDLPKTRNAKVMRRVIRAAYLGNDPGDLSSLENGNSIEDIRNAI